MNSFYDFSIEVSMTETITLKDVRDELAGEIEYMLDVYCGENEVSYIEYERVLEAHEHHAPNGSYHYDFINDDMFLKCIGLSTGETTIDAVLEQYKNYLEVQENRNALEAMDFDWDTYCKYCYI